MEDHVENNKKTKAPALPVTTDTPFRHAVILPDGRKPMPLGSGIITSVLGEGGMANVYEIWNQQLEVHRAVKLLHPNCSDESKQRFQTEIKITAKLHHPNIIEIHGVGEWNNLPYIEMEKIDGYTLETLIADRGALPFITCIAIGIMISRALVYAHNQNYVIYGTQYRGVIHRDLKPSNIMLCRDGTVKLMDFGIARPTDASIHTTDGSIMGTMQYLSPEQLEGKEPDVRTDVYALGTTIYEALTGTQAFPERNVSKLMMNKIRNEFRPLDDYSLHLPHRLRRVIHKSMVHDRDRRVPSAQHLLNELEKILKIQTMDSVEQIIKQTLTSSPAQRLVISSRRRFPVKPLAISAAVVVTAVGISLFFSQPQKPAPAPVSKTMPVLPGETPQAPAVPAAELQTSPETDSPNQPPVPISKTTPRPSVEKKQAPSPSPVSDEKPLSLTEKLIRQHKTADILEILLAEYEQGNYANADALFSYLSPEQTQNSKAAIYRLRTLAALNKRADLQSFLSKTTVNDAEIHLEKAKLAFSRGAITEAQTLLNTSLSAPRQFIESEKLKRDVYYHLAMCASALFDAQPDETTYKTSLDAWWQVRSEIRTQPDHAYNKKAVAETQRIGEKYRIARK